MLHVFSYSSFCLSLSFYFTHLSVMLTNKRTYLHLGLVTRPKCKLGYMQIIRTSGLSAARHRTSTYVKAKIFDVRRCTVCEWADQTSKCNYNLIYDKKAELSQRWPRNACYIWMSWKFSGVPRCAHGYYSQNFNGLLLRSIVIKCVQYLNFVDLP